MKRLIPCVVTAGAALVLAAAPATAAPDCAAMAKLALKDTAISEVHVNATGSFTPPGARARALDKLPAFCSVKGVIKPTPKSSIQFELWLPEQNWNGKLQVVGNGGLAGTISYPAMATALRDGFATASTDTGHTADESPTWLQAAIAVVDQAFAILQPRGRLFRCVAGVGAGRRKSLAKCRCHGRVADGSREAAVTHNLQLPVPVIFW